MSRIHNDTVAAVAASIEDAIKASNAAESKAATVAYAVSLLIGDASRFGEVVPLLQWAASPESMKQVTTKVVELLELDNASVRASVKGISDAAKIRTITARATASRAIVQKAVKLLGAMAVLADRTDSAAEYSNGQWKVPTAWYVAAEYEVVVTKANPVPRITFKSRRATDTVLVMNKDGEPTAINVSATVDGTITAAYGKAEREGSSGQGSTEGSKTVPGDIEAAVGMLGDAIAGDDYTATFSGDAADHMAQLMAHIVRNERLWDMIQGERADYIASKSKAA